MNPQPLLFFWVGYVNQRTRSHMQAGACCHAPPSPEGRVTHTLHSISFDDTTGTRNSLNIQLGQCGDSIITIFNALRIARINLNVVVGAFLMTTRGNRGNLDEKMPPEQLRDCVSLILRQQANCNFTVKLQRNATIDILKPGAVIYIQYSALLGHEVACRLLRTPELLRPVLVQHVIRESSGDEGDRWLVTLIIPFAAGYKQPGFRDDEPRWWSMEVSHREVENAWDASILSIIFNT